MTSMLGNNRGSAMLVALFFILGLTVTAAIIVRVAGGEKHVAYNEYTHMRSFYSSDAGSEEAINWIRTRPVPPVATDAQNTVRRQTSYTDLYTSGSTEENKFKNTITWAPPMHFRPGWSHDFRDFDFTINSDGASAQQSEASIEVQASRLFHVGYN